MSQKTITSFFSSRGTTSGSSGSPRAPVNSKTLKPVSPVITKKKRKLRYISDSEEEEVRESLMKVEKSPVTYSKTNRNQRKIICTENQADESTGELVDGQKEGLKEPFNQDNGMNQSIKREKRALESGDSCSDECVTKDDLFDKVKCKPVKKLIKVETEELKEEPNVNNVKSPSNMEEADNKKKNSSKKTKIMKKSVANSVKNKVTPKQTETKQITLSFSSTTHEIDSTNETDNVNSGIKGPVSAFDYNPADPKYHPINDACWKKGENVPYLALAKALIAVESITARLKRIDILSNLLRSVMILTPEDFIPCVYLCLNKVAPDYEGVELGIGEMVLMKAIAQSTGRTLSKLRAEVKAKGDLGLVAESSRSNQKTMFQPVPLTVRFVFARLKELAEMTGQTSVSKKMDKIQSMLVACRSCEARFLIRSLVGKLRIGLAEQSVLAAIAQTVVVTPPGQEYPPKILDALRSMSSESYKKKFEETSLIIKTTYCECPSYDKVIDIILKHGVEALPEHCHITPGIPMKPMLAHPTKGIEFVLQRFDKAQFTCEFKYDGERAQIHRLENGSVHVYSRNQENNTTKYPDIIARIPKAMKEGTQSFIMDTEAVAWDREKKQILPFQVLSTRKKKDANESEIKVQVCIYAFDLLYLNGESLVKRPFRERRELLHNAFNETEGEFMFVGSLDSEDTEKIAEFLDVAVKGNCEGLMVKTLDVDATYEIAKRSRNWLKLKKDYLEGVGDTLDLLVIGGYHGKGKRTGHYGGFLLACYDEENEEYQSICKLGTGFKDEDLEVGSKFFKAHVIDDPKPYYRYDSSLKPDEWFDAVQVWEIKCADLSISPIHKAAIGIVDDSKGISLRFPRFVRVRDDKTPETCTTATMIADMYNNQEQIKNQNPKVENELDDTGDY